MELLAALKTARETARKNHDSTTLDSLQGVLSAIKNDEINRGSVLTDSEVETVIAKQVKQLSDALVDFTKAARVDLVEKTNTEIKLLQSFLPEQLSDAELANVVAEVLAGLGALTEKESGKATGAVMNRVKGRADGNRVRAEILKQIAA